MLKIKNAFTLAEMMVVMLIMSIILAAMAPVMTTRNKSESLSPWRYTDDGSNAYFGIAKSQIAMIGQRDLAEDNSDDPARLIINADSDSTPIHLSFKRNNTKVGRLQLTGDANLVLGSADLASATGTKNSSFGINSMDGVTSGSANTAIGAESLKSVTSGSYNTGVGEASLYSNTSGEGNIAIGSSALRNNTTASNNIGIGQDSLLRNTTGYWNIGIGNQSLYSNDTGYSNVAIGYGALYSNSTGTNNVAIGPQSMYSNTTGLGNVATGYQVLHDNTIGEYNIASGYWPLYHNTTGSRNIAFGGYPLYLNTTGSDNIASGNWSLYSNTTGSQNLSLGTRSLRNNTGGANNVSTGFEALYSNTTGSGNIATGYQALYYNTTGSNNIAIGNNAMNFNDIGNDTTNTIAIGPSTIASNRTTIAIGTSTVASNNDAIAIGNEVTASGESSIAIGSYEETHTTEASGEHAIAIGDGAISTNNNSIAIGTKAEALGSHNIAIGTNACKNVTGSNKVCIGNQSGPKTSDHISDDENESLYFGSAGNFVSGKAVNIDTNSIFELHKKGNYAVAVLNADLIVRGFSWLHVGGKSGHDDAIGFLKSKTWGNQIELYNEPEPSVIPLHTNLSDRRLKYVGKESTSGLDKIRELKVFNYTFKRDEKKTPHVGVIAQDLQKVFPDAVKKGADGFLTIRFEDMFYAMINAIKELDAKYQAQAKRISDLEKRIEALEEKLK